ncbi:MAG: PQQ-binding-like beta-propeller repeat protein, partial [candidate division Zixibacteria bacterium]|nr:PQQ-binding-like beta-propeller repeat protein [candidate division Zixibacteria bacterium]
MRNVSLITLFLIGILMIPQVVDSSGARNAGDFEDDMLEGRVKAESDDPIWPMECGNPKHTGLSDFLFGDNPGKIKKTFSQEICMTPVVGSDGVIYSGGVLSFFAIYPNGTTKWEYTQDRAISTAAIQKDGSIVFANYSRSLVCLHSSNGTKRWVMPGNFRNTPTIGNDGTIYVTGIHNSAYALFALNPDGTERWNYSMGALSDQYSSPAVDDNGTVYIGYSNYSNTPSSSHLCAIHPNGTLRWERQMEHSPITTPSIGPNNEIYVGQAMNLYAFDTNGTEI